jgi:putative ABC transport system permease protein
MRWVANAIEAVKVLFRKEKMEEELEQELLFHLEMEEEKYIQAGMSPQEARRLARRRLGGVERVKEEVRDERAVRPLEDFLADARYALRRMAKRPGFAAVVIPTLAVGIGANVAMFSVLHTTLIRSLPYSEADRLVVARSTTNGVPAEWVSAWDYWDYRNQSRSLTGLAAFLGFPQGHTITGRDEPERVQGQIVGTDYFRTLGADPEVGRHFTSEDAREGAPEVVIISHGLWQRRFGASPGAVGSTLLIDGYPYTVIGALPAGFRFMDDADLWRPLRRDSKWVAGRENMNWIAVGRLADRVSVEQAQNEINVIARQLEAQYPDSNTGRGWRLQRAQEALTEDYRQTLVMVMAAVVLILLIACGNVAGLALARGSARRTEFSVRAALGASGGRLVRQLLTESLVVAIAAGIMGTWLAVVLVPVFLELLSVRVPGAEEAGLSAAALIFAVAVSMATALLFGMVPAFRASRRDAVEDLKAGARTTDAGGARFRSGLVVAQVALSLVLLIGSGLLLRSLARLNAVDPGFDPRGLLTAEIRVPYTQYGSAEELTDFFISVQENIHTIPGVEGVGLINRLPVREVGGNEFVYAVDDPPAERAETRTANLRAVLPGYFATMGIPLLEGRTIEAADGPDAEPVLVINRSMAEFFFPGESPVGKRMVVFVHDSTTFTVVGVAGDVRQDGLRGEPFRSMYASYRQLPHLTMRIAVRTTGEPASVVPALREVVHRLDPDVPVAEVATMDEVLARYQSAQRVRTIALATTGLLALLLTAIGLSGVLATYVAERRHEIGIRMAFGALRADLMGMILGRAARLVLVGIGIGVAAALATTRLIEGMLFEIEPRDPATFAFVIGFLAAVCGVAALLPGRRAAGVDPLPLLRAE